MRGQSGRTCVGLLGSLTTLCPDVAIIWRGATAMLTFSLLFLLQSHISPFVDLVASCLFFAWIDLAPITPHSIITSLPFLEQSILVVLVLAATTGLWWNLCCLIIPFSKETPRPDEIETAVDWRLSNVTTHANTQYTPAKVFLIAVWMSLGPVLHVPSASNDTWIHQCRYLEASTTKGRRYVKICWTHKQKIRIWKEKF